MTIEITFNDRTYPVHEGESVLDGLERHGVAVPSSCRNGVCQSCLMRATSGEVPASAQSGLKPTQKERGYFLACQFKPTGNVTVALPDAADQRRFTARVVEKTRLNPTVSRIRLSKPQDFQFKAGQFMRVYRDGESRSYSIASMPQQDYLELHIKVFPGGHFSSWLCQTVQVGEELTIGEATGDCFYLADNLDQPLLMIATGTGLAPLWGVVRDALAQGHRGEIHIFHGSYVRDGLYYMDEFAALAAKFPNVRYYPCVSDDPTESQALRGQADVQALKHFPKLNGWRLYLCGNPDMVNTMKRKAFLAGASLKDILADPFIVTVPRQELPEAPAA